MSWSEITLLVLVVVGVLGWLAWVSASRLDRLHRKVSASRIALDSQLVRRASAAADLATSGLLDPASSVLVADAAYAVVDEDGPVTEPEQALAMATLSKDRERLESALSATLREAFDDDSEVAGLRSAEPGTTLVANLAASWYRAQLARRFHNEAVAQAQRARRHWYARWLHLAGRAPWPQTVELDDQMPAGLDAAAQP
ncbi:hypothetical protein Xcel_1661 [Xylanimonas cellulosilytica DSM 15894]|uniref:NUDIX hydrolase n=1 Tax=Xylanimonas cellulosilytica (strain DSM 15894 / JCM 12276 / CECT 5975 / KCTC 9989 / LMG 20990 / NBRC 107835 / XIL07) TaxID=446471 RepID=D1BSJ2_XYLCX|nr:hypothetical protein [Xylanimonas cellulosilytica]ACZ30684.1 hypothetical protein Xcel_1661 [Xylanimonas cellulosilytica DSM 15894]